ncbi:MAG: hypothetical protein HON94_07060 [Methylococcales bacterium]|jgi:hypothetical protein|nr:hypothetical protein [Methylococcales bacterium]MBT7409288.1 hypothetical protein [Methylococcales bacterium]
MEINNNVSNTQILNQARQPNVEQNLQLEREEQRNQERIETQREDQTSVREVPKEKVLESSFNVTNTGEAQELAKTIRKTFEEQAERSLQAHADVSNQQTANILGIETL